MASMCILEPTMAKPSRVSLRSLCVAVCGQEAVAGSHQPVSEDRVARGPIGGRQIHAQPLVYAGMAPDRQTVKSPLGWHVHT